MAIAVLVSCSRSFRNSAVLHYLIKQSSTELQNLFKSTKKNSDISMSEETSIAIKNLKSHELMATFL